MQSLIFLFLFVGIQSLGTTATSNHCREDDHYQNQGQTDRRMYLEGDEIRSRFIPASIPAIPGSNKNSNINYNAGSYQQSPSEGQPQSQSQQQQSPPLRSQPPSQPATFATYTEWWEVVTERIPHIGRSSLSKMAPASRANSYDTIKSRYDAGEASRHESASRSEPQSEDSHNRKSSITEKEQLSTETKKHSPALQGTSRRSKLHSVQDKASKILRSYNPQKSRGNEESSDIPKLLSRKSNENHNTNVNQNSARRNSNTAELNSRSDYGRRANSNTNKNVNVNDRSGVGADDNMYDLYQALGRGSMDSDIGPKALGQSRPISERTHSNVNHNSNVNANLHGDNSLSPAINPEDLRRNSISKKRYLPRSHHPNDNRNVNININGEEPMDDQADDLMGDQTDAVETEGPPTQEN